MPFIPIPSDINSVTTVADSGGNGGALSGLANIFSSIGTAVTNVYRAVNPQSLVTTPSGAVINPATGQVIQGPTTVGGFSSNTVLLIGAAIIAIVLLKR